MVVGDRVTNVESLGKFILKDCGNFPIYSLEKKKNFVDGGKLSFFFYFLFIFFFCFNNS